MLCPTCKTLHSFGNCFFIRNRQKVSKKCIFVEFPNVNCGEREEHLVDSLLMFSMAAFGKRGSLSTENYF